MKNYLILLILALIVIGVGAYLIRAKQKGETCIGCPYTKNCGGKCGNKKI